MRFSEDLKGAIIADERAASESNELASAELDELISLAYDIQNRLDRFTSRLAIYRCVEVTFILINVLMIVFGYTGYMEPFSRVTLTALLSVAAGYTVAIELLFVFRTQNRRRAEQRALSRVIALIRETESVYARHAGWSALHRAKFQIQLSQFGI